MSPAAYSHNLQQISELLCSGSSMSKLVFLWLDVYLADLGQDTIEAEKEDPEFEASLSWTVDASMFDFTQY